MLVMLAEVEYIYQPTLFMEEAVVEVELQQVADLTLVLMEAQEEQVSMFNLF